MSAELTEVGKGREELGNRMMDGTLEWSQGCSDGEKWRELLTFPLYFIHRKDEPGSGVEMSNI